MQHSTYKGHPIEWIGNFNGKPAWIFSDTAEPIPEHGGKPRPCIHCGSGFGDHDECLGLLPCVDAACCGHGDASEAYVRFSNGVELRGFTVEAKSKKETRGELRDVYSNM